MEKTKKVLVAIGTACSKGLRVSCWISFGLMLTGLGTMFFADRIDMKQRKIKFNK